MSQSPRTDPVAASLSLAAVVLFVVAPVASLLGDLHAHRAALAMVDATRFLDEMRGRCARVEPAELGTWHGRRWFDNGSAATARFAVTTTVVVDQGSGDVVSFVLHDQASGAELLRTATMRSEP